ncbi:MAG: methionine biosynthesis protein MetW [Anaerolineales bacterium]|nr:methionine biosynthesis protein MetW [Anaerolineales bacterium]
MMLRSDLQSITELIPNGSKVLDLGCGDGALLEYLVQKKQVRGRGIELSEAGVLACVKRGLSVRQGDLEEGLADYPDASFDYVILSQTLPYVDNPDRIVREMLRVGRQGIVSFSNWGYWRCRLHLLLTGRIPQAPDLPQPWYAAPRWQAFTITDFSRFCRQQNFSIDRQIYLAGAQPCTYSKFKNLLATTAIFALGNGSLPPPAAHQ